MKKIFLTAACMLLVLSPAFATKQTLTSSDTGAQSRTKLNANFTELYDGKANTSCFATEAAFNACFDLTWAAGGSMSWPASDSAYYAAKDGAWASLATVYQPLDSDLTTFAGLACTENQIPKKNGSGVWACGSDVEGAGGGISHATSDGNYYASRNGAWANLGTVFAAVLGSDDNYVTDAEKVKLSNLSGTNTGDQSLTSLGIPGIATTGISGTLTFTKTGTTARIVTFPDTAGTVAMTSDIVASPTDATITTTDVTTNNASTTKHGWLLKATAPSSGLRNIVAIDNGETVYKNAALFDATSPSTQAFGDAATVGTAMTSARRDHKHAMPAAPTTITGNAGTATALATARNIGGVSFNGTANINLPGVNTTGNQNTSGTAAGLTAQYIDWNSASGGSSIANKPTIPNMASPGAIGGTTPAAGTFTTLGAGASGFSVDADGDVTAKSVTITRTTSPMAVRFYEGTGGGDNYIDLTLSGNLSGDSTVNLDALSVWAGITPGSGVGTFLGTPSSANFATAVTGETGSGALVFGTSPTLTTPIIADGSTLTFDESAADPNDADVALSATDGVFKIAAVNGANNEDLTIDLDADANIASVKSSTSVSAIRFDMAIQSSTVFNSYASAQTLTAASHNGTLVQMTTADEVTLWDCETANVGQFVILWARDAEKIEVVPASGDQFFLFNGTGIGANDELDVPATAGTKVTLMCTADDSWSVIYETATTTDGGAAD